MEFGLYRVIALWHAMLRQFADKTRLFCRVPIQTPFTRYDRLFNRFDIQLYSVKGGIKRPLSYEYHQRLSVVPITCQNDWTKGDVAG